MTIIGEHKRQVYSLDEIFGFFRSLPSSFASSFVLSLSSSLLVSLLFFAAFVSSAVVDVETFDESVGFLLFFLLCFVVFLGLSSTSLSLSLSFFYNTDSLSLLRISKHKALYVVCILFLQLYVQNRNDFNHQCEFFYLLEFDDRFQQKYVPMDLAVKKKEERNR
jgi:hypothetical protein